MKFDNSQANLFQFCPAAWEERYVNNLELDLSKLPGTSALIFGSRFHKLLEGHYMGREAPTPTAEELPIEEDVQVMFARYKATYLEEPFEVVEWEKLYEIPLNARHTFVVKIDGIVRMKDSGKLKILDTKTEKRGSKANSDQRWAVMDQGTAYMWAGEKVFGEEFDGVILNVCTKASPKKQEPEEFRRLRLERSRDQLERFCLDAIRIGEHMELAKQIGCHQHREECVNVMTGWRCDYFDLHLIGRSPETLFKYREAEDYLGTVSDCG